MAEVSILVRSINRVESGWSSDILLQDHSPQKDCYTLSLTIKGDLNIAIKKYSGRLSSAGS